MSKPILTQEYLKSRFDYNPDTGEFKRKLRFLLRKTGWISRQGYHVVDIADYNYPVHRLAWVYMYGSIPEKMQIDHINHDRADNRLDNLRLATNQHNQMNRRYSGNSSGVIGVSWDKSRQLWIAQIKVNQKQIQLGRFKDIQEAIAIRLFAESYYDFHPNHGQVVKIVR